MDRRFDTGQSEYLIHNKIDSDVKKFFTSLNFPLSLLFLTKFSVRDNFITHKRSLSIFLSILCITAMNAVNICRVMFDNNDDVPYLYLLTMFDVLSASVGMALGLHCAVEFRHTNIAFVLKIQEIYIALNIRHKFYSFIKMNYIHIMVYCLIYIILLSFLISYFGIIRLQYISMIWLFVLDTYVIYITQITKVLRVALREWVCDTPSSDLTATKHCAWETKFSVFVHIFECFEMTKQVYQLLLLHFWLDCFIHTLCYVKIIIELARMNSTIVVIPFCLTVVWVTKILLTQTILCVELERYYITVDDVIENSLWRLGYEYKQCLGKEMKMYKNVVRMSRIAPKMELCKCFTLDATMPWKLVSIIATYIIVLLQLAISNLF